MMAPNPPQFGPEDEAALLVAAREKGRRLVERLKALAADLAGRPPDPALTPQQRSEGKAALDNAIASATRMLASLDAAMAMLEEGDDAAGRNLS